MPRVLAKSGILGLPQVVLLHLLSGVMILHILHGHTQTPLRLLGTGNATSLLMGQYNPQLLSLGLGEGVDVCKVILVWHV